MLARASWFFLTFRELKIVDEKRGTCVPVPAQQQISIVVEPLNHSGERLLAKLNRDLLVLLMGPEPPGGVHGLEAILGPAVEPGEEVAGLGFNDFGTGKFLAAFLR